MKRILFAALAASTALGFASAEDELVTGSVPATPKITYAYTSAISPDGTVRVVPDVSNPPEGINKPQVLTTVAPDVRKTEQLLQVQDWYMVVGADGNPVGVYTVPKGKPLASSVLRDLNELQSVVRVTPGTSFLKVFPTQTELAAQLETLTVGARDAVCAGKNRPREVSAKIDVQPGWAAAGNIEFAATWTVEDLCADKNG